MDRDPLGYAYSLEGEHTLVADRLRREARDLRAQAEQREIEASRVDEMAVWARTLAEALAAQIENGSKPEAPERAEGSNPDDVLAAERQT